MKRSIVAFAMFALTGCITVAEDSAEHHFEGSRDVPAPAWVADQATGCRLRNITDMLSPNVSQTVTWNGACVNGFADGMGTAVWKQTDGTTTESPGFRKAGDHIRGYNISFEVNNTEERSRLVNRPQGRYSQPVYPGRWIPVNAAGCLASTEPDIQEAWEYHRMRSSQNAPWNPTWSGALRRVWKPTWNATWNAAWTGSCIEGLADGRGKVTISVNGSIWFEAEGVFQNGLLTSGTVTRNPRWGCGSCFTSLSYKGSFQDGVPHGRGEIRHANNDHFIGSFQRGVPHGRGEIKYGNGDSYTGEFAQGRPVGQTAFQIRDEAARAQRRQDEIREANRRAAQFAEQQRSGAVCAHVRVGDRVLLGGATSMPGSVLDVPTSLPGMALVRWNFINRTEHRHCGELVSGRPRQS